MNRKVFDLEINITLTAPYLVHGNDPGRWGLDATLMLDAASRPGMSQPILPGSLLAGRIVETWQSCGNDLGGVRPEHWFGESGGSGKSNSRARLLVDDLKLTHVDGEPFDTKIVAPEITRIRESKAMGAVIPGALLVIEQAAEEGATLAFTGTWRCWATDAEIEPLRAKLRVATVAQTQLGAMRNVGFGRLTSARYAQTEVTPRAFALPKFETTHRLALKPRHPLCVGAQSRRGNVFESSDIITGATLLGALATMLASRHGKTSIQGINSPLARHFSSLRVTHALPTPVGQPRPLPLPQSLVSLNDKIFDAARLDKPPEHLTATPAFQTDWKHHPDANGWGATHGHLRVRTDIDARGTAKASSLFAYECITPALDDEHTATTEWLCDLDLSGVMQADERAAVASELDSLLAFGIFPLGKTDAIADVDLVSTNDPRSGNVWSSGIDTVQKGRLVPLLLVTDAMLFPTDHILTAVELVDVYRRAFDELIPAGSEGALRLHHHFATQRLEGGDFLNHRYMRPKGRNYQPWVLTEAGSVFVFEILDTSRASNILRSWQSHGLGLPRSVVSVYGGDWTDLPYLPHCGYGEVIVDPTHGFDSL